jgi:hypothetical protein
MISPEMCKFSRFPRTLSLHEESRNISLSPDSLYIVLDPSYLKKHLPDMVKENKEKSMPKNESAVSFTLNQL